MAHADVLYDFVLMVAKFVKIAIDSGKIHILVKVVFHIFHRSSLARWICQTGFHKLAEHFIVNTIETNPVKRAVKYQVASVEKDVADIGQNTADFFSITVTRLTLLTIQIELWMASGFFLGNPFFRFIDKIFDLIFIICNTNRSKFLHLATDFLNNNNSVIAGWIFLFADKHS